jgi:type I restriction enzyme S subunit
VSFKPYPKYKESGVEWLGRVPEHWSVCPIKWLSKVQRGASPRPIDDPRYFDDEGEFAWVRIADVSACSGVLHETTQRLSSLGSSLSVRILPNELFVSIAGTVGKPCLAGIKACIHDGFVYFPTLRMDPVFLFRVFEAGICYGGLGKLGTQLNLNTDTIGAIRVAVPPASEVHAILTVLDHEIAKIDALIAEQQRLIELLQEKRQAVISHAVTKGLNPDAPMKDSGIEWLGQVPEHWKIGRCRFYMTMLSGFAFPSQGFSADEGDCRLLRGINVGVGSIRWDETVFWKRESGDGLDRYELQMGDLVLGMDRPLIAEGMRVARLSEQDVPSLLLQRVVRLTAGESLEAEYLEHLLGSEMFVAHFAPETTGVSVPHISPDQIASFVIPVPPIEEQKAILERVAQQKSISADLISEAGRMISLLQERRSALISAAVTGQIDVRGFSTGGGSEAA